MKRPLRLAGRIKVTSRDGSSQVLHSPLFFFSRIKNKLSNGTNQRHQRLLTLITNAYSCLKTTSGKRTLVNEKRFGSARLPPRGPFTFLDLCNCCSFPGTLPDSQIQIPRRTP